MPKFEVCAAQSRVREIDQSLSVDDCTAAPPFPGRGLSILVLFHNPQLYLLKSSQRHVPPSPTRQVTDSVALNDLQVNASFLPITHSTAPACVP